MDTSSAIGAVLLLLAAAFAFQLIWYTALAFLIWAPPAYLGIVAGWIAYTASDNVFLSIVSAVLAHRATRCVMKGAVVAWTLRVERHPMN